MRSRGDPPNRSPDRSTSGQALRDDNVRRLCNSFCRGERLFAREWISVQVKGMTEEALVREDPRGWHPSRHPDNVPGQDPCPSRKTGQTIGAGQALFLLSYSDDQSNRLFGGRGTVDGQRCFEQRSAVSKC